MWFGKREVLLNAGLPFFIENPSRKNNFLVGLAEI
jgi:hypothetical protein